MKAPLLNTLASLAMSLAVSGAAAQDVYYECPGSVFTNTISAADAAAKGCKAREALHVTTIAGPAVRGAATATPRPRSSGGGREAASAESASARVQASEQRARDTDARRILEGELAREQTALEALKRDYNGGQPERQGDERNYAKYQERAAQMKAAVDRKEADVAAIRRELSKLTS